MATRPAKATHGTTTYTAEVAAGATNVLASDVDGDFSQIYTNIDNTNVATGAGIAYSKLALTNSILAADLTANSVTTTKIADLNVTTTKIADLGVTTAKIAAGNSVRTRQTAINVGTVNISSVTETTIVQGASFTPRTGAIMTLLVGGVGKITLNSGTSITYRVKIYRDAAFTILIQNYLSDVSHTAGSALILPFPLSITTSDTAVGSAHRYGVRIEITAITGSAAIDFALNAASLDILELA